MFRRAPEALRFDSRKHSPRPSTWMWWAPQAMRNLSTVAARSLDGTTAAACPTPSCEIAPRRMCCNHWGRVDAHESYGRRQWLCNRTDVTDREAAAMCWARTSMEWRERRNSWVSRMPAELLVWSYNWSDTLSSWAKRKRSRSLFFDKIFLNLEFGLKWEKKLLNLYNTWKTKKKKMIFLSLISFFLFCVLLILLPGCLAHIIIISESFQFSFNFQTEHVNAHPSLGASDVSFGHPTFA